MWWWIGAVACLLLSAVWIVYVMADGFRRKVSFIRGGIWGAYAFHAAFAVLGAWLLLRAVGV